MERQNSESRQQSPSRYIHRPLPPIPKRSVIPELRHLDFDPPEQNPDASSTNSNREQLRAQQQSTSFSGQGLSNCPILRRKAPVRNLRMQAMLCTGFVSLPKNPSTDASSDIWIGAADLTSKLSAGRPSINGPKNANSQIVASGMPIDRRANATPRLYVGHDMWQNVGECPIEPECNEQIGEPLTSTFSWSDCEVNTAKTETRGIKRIWRSLRN